VGGAHGYISVCLPSVSACSYATDADNRPYQITVDEDVVAAELHMPAVIGEIETDGLLEVDGAARWAFASDRTFATLPPCPRAEALGELRVHVPLAEPCAILRSCVAESCEGSNGAGVADLPVAAVMLHLPLAAVTAARRSIAAATVTELHIFVDGSMRGGAICAVRDAVLACLAALHHSTADQSAMHMRRRPSKLRFQIEVCAPPAPYLSGCVSIWLRIYLAVPG
jgi:hypothetical protein